MDEVFAEDLPPLTEDNFESRLASDSLLVHYFNAFLSLPSFTEDLFYNQEMGQFEVNNEAAEEVSKNIRRTLKQAKLKLIAGDSSAFADILLVDNSYLALCLEKEQGMEWMIEERLPFFIQSDCYYEYRLAKLLLQNDPDLIKGKRKSHSGLNIAPPALQPHRVNVMEALGSDFLDESPPEVISTLRPVSEQTQDSPTARVEPAGHAAEEQQQQQQRQQGQQQQQQQQLPPQTGEEQPSAAQVDGESNNAPGEEGGVRIDKEISIEDEQKRIRCAELVEEYQKKADEIAKVEQPSFEEYKEFLRGTPGENILKIWLDIERLRATQDLERKARYLVLMRNWYLHSSSPCSLALDMLHTLGLTTSPSWTEERLQSVQLTLTETEFSYWALRFWTYHLIRATPQLIDPQTGDWSIPAKALRDESESMPLRMGSYVYGSLGSRKNKLSAARGPSSGLRSQVPASKKLSEMLEALLVEPQAGSYFTRFCEQSGNRLWANAVYFWNELQYYHDLFCQESLDPHKVQREAQLLYSTYVFSSARRSIDVGEHVRREVYYRLHPAFEELFDLVEEHALNILLEPWTLLVSKDTSSFQQLNLLQEVRHLNSPEYIELLNLKKEPRHLDMMHKKKLKRYRSVFYPSAGISPTEPSEEFPELGPWASVPQSYRGYRLDFLLHQRQEIGHFMSFLQSHDASIHLMCWLDLEQYKKTPLTETTFRQERWWHIGSQYLHDGYFFGPPSPATTEQKSHILRLTGGLNRIQNERQPNAVAEMIQDIVRNYLEEKWLPLFLATPEFAERQKEVIKLQTVGKFFLHGASRRKYKREPKKQEDCLWRNSTKEILLLRKALSNPVVCQQFLDFVAVKGDFLENDVRFWHEVQLYKDLCHSHSDESTIQHKITTIINCFVNSIMPPTLQIDIPPDQAQRILEKRFEQGPYIFREAQMSVFGEMLKYWPEFEKLSSTVKEEHLLPLLQSKRQQYRAKVRKQKRKEEEAEDRKKNQVKEEKVEQPEDGFLDEEEDTDDDDQEEEREKKPVKKHGRYLTTQTRSLLWSYSKYMAGLKKEEALLRKQRGVDTPSSSGSDSSLSLGTKEDFQRMNRALFPAENRWRFQ